VIGWDRYWIPAVLAVQVIGGAFLGLLVQLTIVVLTIRYVMPWIGTDLLAMARHIASLDLPSKVGF
jgi:type III secretory pathway component EscS